jgi:putative membrane protein
MRHLLITAAVTVVLASPATAQIGNPAGVEPGTPQSAPGVPAPDHANTQDRLFARLATSGGMAEVELGKLAEQKGQRDEIKTFARRMVQDHSKANAQLASLAKQAGIPLPNELDAEHQAMRAELDKVSGAQFDLAYMRGQVVDHQKTVLLLQWEISFGQDADLQKFASQILPGVLEHLQTAQNIMALLSGQSPQGAAPDVMARKQ